MNTRRTLRLALAGAFLYLLSAPMSAWAQAGRVTGTVTNVRTAYPVETAQVYVPGTRIGTLTDQYGNFTLTIVPAGEVEIRVEIIGYRTQSQVVTVGQGETQVLEFALEPTVLQLQELVVTGTAARMPKAKLPFTVERLDVEDMPVPATSAERQIQGKGAGVHVVRGSGQPGDAADIMLRSPTSITRGQGPLIILDGAIVWETMADIDALDIESIEIVKGAAAASLYGSLAANGVIQITTQRGRGLAAGESQVTTRGEFGFQSLEGDFPFRQQHPYQMNAAGTKFLNADGEEIDYGPGVELDAIYIPDPDVNPAYNGDLTSVTFQDRNYPAPTFDHVERFFDPGNFSSLNVAVTGKTANTNYRASFTNLREQGVILFHNGYKRRNARLNIDHQLWEDLSLSLSGYYAWAFQDEVTSNNPLFDLTFMPPNFDMLSRVCLDPADVEPDSPECRKSVLNWMPDPLNTEEANPLYTQQSRTSEDRNSRVLGSLFARYSPTPWLDIEADFGLDRFDFHQFTQTPKGERRPNSPITQTGFLQRRNDLSQNVNASLTAALHQQFGDIIARGQARYQFEDRHIEWFRANGSNLATEDVLALEITDPAGRTVQSQITDINSNFFYLVGTADYKGRYIVDGLVRWDGSSLFGEENRWNTYYRASLAWRPSQEPWWFINGMGELKLRGSYGTAGNRPSFAAQYETYSVSGGTITPVTLGNSQLKPEFVRELELGAEMLLWNRFNAVINYSDNKTEDAILVVPQPGFAGFSRQFRNSGTIEGNTWELSLEAALAETENLSWTARVNWDRTDQKITHLGVPPYRGGNYGEFFFRAGEPLGSYFGNRWASNCAELHPDAQAACESQFQVNDDGYLVWVGDGNSYRDGISNQLWGTAGDVNGVPYEFGMPIKAFECQRRQEDGNLVNLPAAACTDELPAGFTSQQLVDFIRIGDTTPDFALSLSTNLRYKNFTLYALFDGEFGHDMYFQTGQWTMRELASGEVDQAGKSDDNKKPIKYYSTLYNVNETNNFYIRDGSYVKVRELALGYTFRREQVRSLLGFIGLESATIRLVGRNLLTFTDFPGYDPETSEGTGGSDVIGRTDAYNYPNFRTITAMVDLTF